MKQSYRDLLKHSGIYAFGQAILRVTSIVLLPIYTRYLTPADYGVLAILEITVSLLRITLANGLVTALNRHHFDSDDERSRDQLWWTGLALQGLSLLAIVGPLLVLRAGMAEFSLGDIGEQGSRYIALTLITVCFVAAGVTLQTHLRVYKKSGLLVVLSLVQAVLNVALNLILLIPFEMGVSGVLWGNLIANAAGTLLFGVVFIRSRGSFAFDGSRIRGLVAYGGPLVISSLLALALHKLDRYWIRIFLDLKQVGIYSVAYAIGQGINTLLLQPFSRIWYVVIYEVAGTAEAHKVYTETFRYFFIGMALLLLGLSVFAQPLIWILVTEEFYPAADLIPIVCLAYLFFSLHTHFNVPALVHKRTTNVIPAHAVALVANTIANLMLIPVYGTHGAAWASVISFAAFSFSGLWVYRRIEKLPYPFTFCSWVLAGLLSTYLVWRQIFSWSEKPALTAVTGAVLWLSWASALSAPLLLRYWREIKERSPQESRTARSVLASILSRR